MTDTTAPTAKPRARQTGNGPFRLASGGRLIDRAFPASFRFDGRHLRGFAGDTLASALLGSGIALVGRSFKYHRPRGVLASGVEEPNALLGIGHGARFEPNQRATTTPLVPGMVLSSQNAWPSRELDIGAINNVLWRFFPAGFYYKTFMQPRAAWLNFFEPIIRRSAGLGRPPTERDPDQYEQAYDFAETVVVGGGIAGLEAARKAAEDGGRVLVLEQDPHWGGRTPIDHADGEDRVTKLLEALRALPNVTLRRNTQATGLYEHGYLLARESLGDVEPDANLPRQRLWRIRAGDIITATGALERPLTFAGNDIPGVMLASAVRDYIVNWGVAPGRRIVVVTNNDDAYRTALAALDAGLEVAAVVDSRMASTGALPQEVRARGVKVLNGTGIAGVRGRKLVSGVDLCAQDGEGAVTSRLDCDCVAMSGGWSPVMTAPR